MAFNDYYQHNLEPRISEAIRTIAGTYGHEVDPVAKGKTLRKFGRNETVGTTRATVADLSGELHETYVSTNTITTVSSSDVLDTQLCKYEYHTIDGSGNFTFGVGSFYLDGRNKVTLPVPCARVNRFYNNDTWDFAGDITIYEDTAIVNGVPTDSTKVHMQMIGTTHVDNQSLKAATTLSNTDYWIVTDIQANLIGSNSARVDVHLEVREKGKVFRTQLDVGLGTGGTTHARFELNPALIVTPNSDIRMTAVSTANGTEVSGYMSGTLASIRRS